MANFTKIRNRELLSQKVYRIIKRDIIRGKLVSNTRLFEEKIAEQMQISRTPVREALRLLAAEGFVELVPNNGIVVNQVLPQDLLDILRIRLQLETYASYLAAKEVTEKDLSNLQIMVEQMEEAVKAKNALEFSNLNLKYHKYITKLSGNKKLCEICDNLYAQSDHWIKAMGVPERLKRSLEEHVNIFKTLSLKDSDCCKQEMHKHLNNVILNISSMQMKGE
ncbi:MAG: GntR family transcriptional regulator [Atribacterota bacterium]|jgi:DNA-binding GntR family transcriptional regulator|nr:GntR family transcriptional regulator [Atribacterota bacterium]MDD3640909.1 GntR family transcriptional regulator [Atribacterota bacterium]MDD4288092.1 GntR family transcriptional regulator [Atribacterota bacterium]MDD4765026.1 GntR family transcriptional regulator [Atribacterota bacterium]MDD5635212.1 GntR family transcriptional regulator [Atribacterota bacterium]